MLVCVRVCTSTTLRIVYLYQFPHAHVYVITTISITIITNIITGYVVTRFT